MAREASPKVSTKVAPGAATTVPGPLSTITAPVCWAARRAATRGPPAASNPIRGNSPACGVSTVIHPTAAARRAPPTVLAGEDGQRGGVEHQWCRVGHGPQDAIHRTESLAQARADAARVHRSVRVEDDVRVPLDHQGGDRIEDLVGPGTGLAGGPNDTIPAPDRRAPPTASSAAPG